MHLIRICLLASATGLVCAASARAADLPTKSVAPAEYVKICSAHGVGFFYIPGTDTCLKISGYAEYDYLLNSVGNNGSYIGLLAAKAAAGPGKLPNYIPMSSKTQNMSGNEAYTRVNFDARSTTAYGTLRAYMSLSWAANTGSFQQLSQGGSGSFTSIHIAYVQWAGLLAGHTDSMFDFFEDSTGIFHERGPDQLPEILSYTASFGNGYSATLSLEDTQQQSYLAPQPGIASATIGKKGATAAAWGYQGTRQPDVVVAARVEQAWGEAQLSGLYHTQNVEASTGLDAAHKDSNSWGVNAGVHLKLPMIAPGDELWLQTTYTKGNLGKQTQGAGRAWGVVNNGNSNIKGWTMPDYDAVVINGSPKLPSAYSAVAAFSHHWSPQWETHVQLGYINVKYPGAVTKPAVSSVLGVTNWNEWTASGGVRWTPVKLLLIDLDLLYAHLDQKAPLLADGKAFTGFGGVPFKKTANTYEAHLRIERDF